MGGAQFHGSCELFPFLPNGVNKGPLTCQACSAVQYSRLPRYTRRTRSRGKCDSAQSAYCTPHTLNPLLGGPRLIGAAMEGAERRESLEAELSRGEWWVGIDAPATEFTTPLLGGPPRGGRHIFPGMPFSTAPRHAGRPAASPRSSWACAR